MDSGGSLSPVFTEMPRAWEVLRPSQGGPSASGESHAQEMGTTVEPDDCHANEFGKIGDISVKLGCPLLGEPEATL